MTLLCLVGQCATDERVYMAIYAEAILEDTVSHRFDMCSPGTSER